MVQSWSFLTNHARALLRIARDPGIRLRDLAAGLGITERSAHAIVADLVTAGYLVKHKHGRRNRYQIQDHLPLPEPAGHAHAIGDVLALLGGDGARQQSRPQRPASSPPTSAKVITSSLPEPRGSRAGHALSQMNRAQLARAASGS